MENKNIKYSLGYINECYNAIVDNRDKIKNLQAEIDNDEKIIKDFAEKTEVKQFISNKLIENINKLDLNKYKDDDQFRTVTYTTSSSNGKTETFEYKEVNPNSKFNPLEDNWEIHSIYTDENGRYKISVENIKGRKHINAFMWEPDIYTTDWFEI